MFNALNIFPIFGISELPTRSGEKTGDKIIETRCYTLVRADGKAIDTGKYRVIWGKEIGPWKPYGYIWNTRQVAEKHDFSLPRRPLSKSNHHYSSSSS